MNLTQYLLSKMAEEAVELAKEALKGQQHGLFSDFNGKKNLEYIRDEYVDLIARSTLLNYCEDVISVVGEKFDIFVDRFKLDRELNKQMQLSIEKMCYYAYQDYECGNLQLTEKEVGIITYFHNQYIPIINRQRQLGH